GHLARWTEGQRAEAAGWIALYKEIRHIVQQGDMYRLRSPHAHPFSALQYVSKDKSAGVLFVFRTHLPRPANLPPISLRGLDPDARYEVEGVEETRTGRGWMYAGISVELGDFGSTVRRIRRVEH
ncbi:MAG: GH36 C-terminal domain-containing protein, partial [Chloroflexales bacterium]